MFNFLWSLLFPRSRNTTPSLPHGPYPTLTISEWPGVQASDPITYNHPLLAAILDNERISVRILDHCPPNSIVRLLKTSHSLRTVVHAYCERKFNIHRLLARYFDNPMSFRYMQACTGTLISGSTALQFFDRSFYPESNLDIYTPKAWRKEMGDFLLREGYKFAPHSSQHTVFEEAISQQHVLMATALYGNFKGIAGVFNFTKQGRDGLERKIQLIVSARAPIEVILRFHSTMVMNVISFDAAYCLYAHATLEARHSLVCIARQDASIKEIYDRYTARGWRILRNIDELAVVSSDPAIFSQRIRWIGDGQSWSIKQPLPLDFRLPPLNARTGPLGRDPVSITSWALTIARGQRTCEMMFVQPREINMFYTYVLAAGEIARRQPVETLMTLAKKYNTGCHSNPLYHRHYVDAQFMELCEEYYRIALRS